MQFPLSIGIIGLGTVGSMLCNQCVQKKYTVHAYDESTEALALATSTHLIHPHSTLQSLLKTDVSIILMALPTLPNISVRNTKSIAVNNASRDSKTPNTGYDLSSFNSVFHTISKSEQAKTTLLFIYSTFVPTTLNTFKHTFPDLHLFHVPEFLSSASVALDSVRPTRPHVLLGVPESTPASITERARMYLQKLVSDQQTVLVVKSNESEATKLFCNTFYATKVQLCNEFYALCREHNISYDMVRQLMLQNGWIHPMHTNVPGADGQLGFGGRCLPKDLEALCLWSEQEATTTSTEKNKPPKCGVLQAVLKEHKK